MTTGTVNMSSPAAIASTKASTIARWVSGCIALILLVGAMQLPLWAATLKAPQYPDGLTMTAYGDRVEGDVDEINILNHYIGMKHFRWGDIPETALWKPSLLLAALAVIVALAIRKTWVHRLALAALWLFPLGVLADIQFRLFQYGHDLAPEPALRVPKFTIWAIGPTKVWNFTTWSMPGVSILMMLLAAAVVTFGPRFYGHVRNVASGVKEAIVGSPA
jgi:copper chaperone NosL